MKKRSLKPVITSLLIATVGGVYADCFYETTKTCVNDHAFVGWIWDDGECIPNAHADGNWSSLHYATGVPNSTGRVELTAPQQCSGHIFYMDCTGNLKYRSNFTSTQSGHDFQRPDPSTTACSN